VSPRRHGVVVLRPGAADDDPARTGAVAVMRAVLRYRPSWAVVPDLVP